MTVGPVAIVIGPTRPVEVRSKNIQCNPARISNCEFGAGLSSAEFGAGLLTPPKRPTAGLLFKT